LRTNRPRRAWLLLPAALIVLVAWWLTRRPDAPPAAPHDDDGHHQAHGPLPPGVQTKSEPGTPDKAEPVVLPDDDEERAEFNRVKAAGARQIIAAIKQNRDFPFWTRPISDANRWAPPRPLHNSQTGDTPAHLLEIWPAKLVFNADEPVVVHARLTDSGRAVRAGSLTGFTDSQPSLMRPEIHFTFRDDGVEGDAAAGDLTYTALIVINTAELKKNPGAWGFRVRAQLGKENIETMNTFMVWPTDVVLTGKYRDTIEDGSLVIYAGVSAKDKAAAQVRAELHGPKGEDIGFAWANQDVPRGESEMRLVFYGKVIADSNINGPYRLEHVVLGVPAHRLIGPVATEVAHLTQPYQANQFRRDPHGANNPVFDQQLREYEDRLRKAERGELAPGKGP
jgi:hypothetical protein